ncbi:MAG: 50S ribosomal protein L11 methyltransferase [Gammaproteobacteria bacterium]|jgi:SAM-dependent methyltransferase|nr:50S ribosomal protein L11 methyltransferase [Gammaproteobacteria bacterium]HJP04956.1 50S ribosomal protein L11 methyltransferase [Gammaproteobacteria bacterium]
MSSKVTCVVLLFIGFAIGVVLASRGLLPAGLMQTEKMTMQERRYKYYTYIDPNTSGTANQGNVLGEPIRFYSGKLEAYIAVLPGVFYPYEAEWTTLPLLKLHPELVRGKTVLEIGTGSGIISLFCAKLGAAKVVATDINPAALETMTLNAGNLGYADIIETRLVSPDDTSAYAVIGEDERFDLILPNPPFAIDLDAPRNDSVTDVGVLGFSIVRGLDQHLEPGGVSVLYYDDLFFHEVMVMFARHNGYEVRAHTPNGLFPWSAETLFNSYLRRLLQREGLPPDMLHFDYHKDKALGFEFLRNAGFKPREF